ncbi:MAG: glutaredoxin domain-containing protein [Methylococcales bacterium]
MTQVTLLTNPTCGYCHAAKNLLQQRGITYVEVDLIKGGEQAQQLLMQSGQRTIPQIFINETPIGGFTELSKLLSNKI